MFVHDGEGREEFGREGWRCWERDVLDPTRAVCMVDSGILSVPLLFSSLIPVAEWFG